MVRIVREKRKKNKFNPNQLPIRLLPQFSNKLKMKKKWFRLNQLKRKKNCKCELRKMKSFSSNP